MVRRSLLLVVAVIAGWMLHSLPARAGGGCHEAPKPFDARTRVVRMAKACFRPVVVRVEAGGEVTWINDDTLTHTVTGAGSTWGSYDDLVAGDRASFKFTNEGVYPYFCAYHPGMVGAVVVGDGAGSGAGSGVALTTSGLSSEQELQSKSNSKNSEDSTSLLWAPIAVAIAGVGLFMWGRRTGSTEQAQASVTERG